MVTGGASGMGEATVRLFAKEGAKVVIGDINVQKGEALAKELNDAGYTVRFYGKMDITKKEDIDFNVQKMIDEFGRIDIFCQYAGGEIGSNFNTDNIHMEVWDATMDRNLKGNVMCYFAIVPYMKKRHSGSIIFCSSNGAMNPPLVTYAYHAAKAGMESMTVNAAFELCRYGIRVNCIIPGPIMTPFWDEVFPKEMPMAEREKFLNDLANTEVPMGRLGRPEDIANVALYYASDLSGYVTGQRTFVGGGMGYINCPEGTFMMNSKIHPIAPKED